CHAFRVSRRRAARDLLKITDPPDSASAVLGAIDLAVPLPDEIRHEASVEARSLNEFNLRLGVEIITNLRASATVPGRQGGESPRFGRKTDINNVNLLYQSCAAKTGFSRR